MANERRARAAPLAALYESITGAPPDDDSLQRMQRVRDALGLNDNDALWSILAVLEYYLRLYDTIPEDIREAGDFSLRNTRHVLILGAGILIMSLMLAHGFGRFHGGL